ncbi:MAG: LacI family DNA-binding transcriptional regulator [Verrucomicrobiia bacterium]
MQAVAKRVTLRDVALATGFDVATVSRALRGMAVVKEATRRRIELAARKLGYRADPMVSALAAYRSRAGRAGLAVPVMVAHLGETEAVHAQPNFQRHVTQMILRRAGLKFAERGYRLEHSFLRDHQVDAATARRWDAMGFQAVIFNTHHAHPFDLKLLKRFCLCSLITEIYPQPVHHLSWDMEAGLVACVRKVVGMGYRRVGFAVYVDPEHLFKRIFVEGLTRYEPLLGQAETSVFGWPDPDAAEGLFEVGKRPFAQWLRRFKPEAIVANNDVVMWWIREAGVKKRPFVVTADRTNDPEVAPGWAGTGPDVELMAQELVELVDRLVKHGDRGAAEHPLRVMVPPRWTEAGSEELSDF